VKIGRRDGEPQQVRAGGGANVKLHWTELAVAAALVAAGCAAIYAALVRALRRAVAEQQQAVDRQLNSLAMTVKVLQARVAELDAHMAAQLPAPAQPSAGGATKVPAENVAEEEQDPVKPATLAAIAAAATAFFGKAARVRAVRVLPVQDVAGAWAQQGRVIVQTSHNLRPGHE
jgi:hypothetical protein